MMTDAVKKTIDELTNSPQTCQAARDETAALARRIGAGRNRTRIGRGQSRGRDSTFTTTRYITTLSEHATYTRPCVDRFRAKSPQMRLALSLTKIADLSYRRSIVCGDGSPLPPLGPGPWRPLNSARLIGQRTGAPRVRSVVSRRQPPRRSGPGPIDGPHGDGTEARSRERHIGPPQIGTHRGRTPPNLGASAHAWSPDDACSPLATESAALVTFTSARPPRKSGRTARPERHSGPS